MAQRRVLTAAVQAFAHWNSGACSRIESFGMTALSPLRACCCVAPPGRSGLPWSRGRREERELNNGLAGGWGRHNRKALSEFVQRAKGQADKQGEGEGKSQVNEENPENLVLTGQAAIFEGDIEKARRNFMQVLTTEMELDRPTKSKAEAGLAQVHASIDDLDSAREMLRMARYTMGENSVHMPHEVNGAEARITLAEKFREDELTGLSLDDLERRAKGEKSEEAAPALRSLALKRFSLGDWQGSLEAALSLVKSHKQWSEDEGAWACSQCGHFQ